MDCDFESEGASKAFWQHLAEKAYRNRIPVCGGIELTARCNLQCVHCYINTPAQRRTPAAELETSRIHHLIDEITDAGCLFLWLTGGEPLLHPDFCEIYRHLRENGIGVTLYTNGTLLSDRHAELFREWRPDAIEMSVYGATRETYEAITGVAGSYNRCMNAIRNVKKTGLNLRLKTILMKPNRDEYFAMRNMAEELNCKFQSSSSIFPAHDGDCSPLKWRLRPDEAAGILLQDAETVRMWAKKAVTPRKWYYSPDALYECAAGSSAFHVSADGFLLACMHIHDSAFRFDLRKGPFLEGWNGPISGVPLCKKNAEAPCNSCGYRPYCTYCPAKLRAESSCSEEPGCESYRCEMARQISEAVKGL